MSTSAFLQELATLYMSMFDADPDMGKQREKSCAKSSHHGKSVEQWKKLEVLHNMMDGWGKNTHDLPWRTSMFQDAFLEEFEFRDMWSPKLWPRERTESKSMAGWQDGGTPWNTMIFSLTSWFHLINYLTDFNIFLKYNLFQNLSIFQHRPLVVVSAQGYFTGRAPTADEFQMHWSQMDLLRVGRVSKKDLAKWLKNGAPQVGVLHPKMVIFLVDWPWILVIYLWIFLWASWLFDVWGCDVDTSFLYLMLLMLLCGGSTCVG